MAAVCLEYLGVNLINSSTFILLAPVPISTALVTAVSRAGRLMAVLYGSGAEYATPKIKTVFAILRMYQCLILFFLMVTWLIIRSVSSRCTVIYCKAAVQSSCFLRSHNFGLFTVAIG